MDEHEFFTQHPMRPWTHSDLENANREGTALAQALWLGNKIGGDHETMKRQLLAAPPEIPAGMGLLSYARLSDWRVSVSAAVVVGIRRGPQKPLCGLADVRSRFGKLAMKSFAGQSTF